MKTLVALAYGKAMAGTECWIMTDTWIPYTLKLGSWIE